MSEPDLVLYNGNIITLDRSSRVVEAVALKGGRIDAVGASEAILKDLSPTARTVGLNGKSVIPGFFDAHPHMDREGLKHRGGVSIAGLRSISDIVGAVAAAVDRALPGEWVVLMPMGEPPLNYLNDGGQLRDGRFPTRHDLDAVSPHNPVYIRAIWGWWGTPPFPSVANSAALARAGIGPDTLAPYRTEIVHDGDGEPTGVFLEYNRAPILEYTLFKGLPRFTAADRRDSVRLGGNHYSALGTTSGYEGHGLTADLVRAYREVSATDELTVRIYAPLSLPSPAKSDAEIKDLLYHWAGVAGGRGFGDDAFRLGGITLDTGDPKTAALIATGYPYEQWAGFFYQGLSDQQFVDIGIAAAARGIRLNTILVNAPPVYDVERCLGLMERINAAVDIRDMRCVGIHLSAATDEQLRRIRALGMAVTMTPSFLHHHAAVFQLDALEDEAMPVRRVLDAGIPVAFGTDNVPPSMLFTLWQSLARWDTARNRRVGEGQLTREEALRISTQHGHYLTWDEDHRGAIEVGKAADLTVLDGDPLTCELDRLPSLTVEMTIMNGRVVYPEPL